MPWRWCPGPPGGRWDAPPRRHDRACSRPATPHSRTRGPSPGPRFLAGQADDPGPGFGRHAWEAPRARQVLHGSSGTQGPRLLDAAHHGGERDPQGPRNGGTAGAVGIGRPHAGPGHGPDGRRARPRQPAQVRTVLGTEDQRRNGAGMGHGDPLRQRIDPVYPTPSNPSP